MNKRLFVIVFSLLMTIQRCVVYSHVESLQNLSLNVFVNNFLCELSKIRLDEKISDRLRGDYSEIFSFLRRFCNPYSYLPIVDSGFSVKTLYGHKGSVNSIIELKAGMFAGCIASASDDRTIKIWNPLTGKCVRILNGHRGGVNLVFELKVGQFAGFLASTSWDRSIRVWNPSTEQCVCILPGHNGFIHSIIQPSCGDFAGYLVSASWDGSIKIWDISEEKCICSISDVVDHDSNLWPLITGENIRHRECFRAIKSAIRLDYGEFAGHYLYDTQECFLGLWDTLTDSSVRVLEKYIHAGKGKVQLRNGTIAAGYVDNSIKIRDISNNCDECIVSFFGHRGFITELIQLKNGNLVSASSDCLIKIWNIYSQKVLDLSLLQYVLVLKLECYKKNEENISLHDDWDVIFESLPDYFQQQYINYLVEAYNFENKAWCNLV